MVPGTEGWLKKKFLEKHPDVVLFLFRNSLSVKGVSSGIFTVVAACCLGAGPRRCAGGAAVPASGARVAVLEGREALNGAGGRVTGFTGGRENNPQLFQILWKKLCMKWWKWFGWNGFRPPAPGAPESSTESELTGPEGSERIRLYP